MTHGLHAQQPSPMSEGLDPVIDEAWGFTEDRPTKAEGLVRYLWGGIFLLLLLCGSEAFAAEKLLGTVFYSPAERRALVAARHGGGETEGTGQGKGGDIQGYSNRAHYTVSGVVSRGDGKSVFWLNGQPMDEGSPTQGLPPIHLSGDQVIIDGKTVKVGETLDMTSGVRSSPLSDSAVKVKP